MGFNVQTTCRLWWDAISYSAWPHSVSYPYQRLPNHHTQCRLFANNFLLYRPVRTPQDRIVLQDHLLHLQRWPEELKC